MYRFGWCYQSGISVEKSKNMAVEWYLKSAITEHKCKGGFSIVYKTSYKRQYGTHEEVAIKIINK
ncbi:9502_t:CDS:2, partial [Cetraspora pellucida]